MFNNIYIIIICKNILVEEIIVILWIFSLYFMIKHVYMIIICKNILVKEIVVIL